MANLEVLLTRYLSAGAVSRQLLLVFSRRAAAGNLGEH
jgi:hypothetical protein